MTQTVLLGDIAQINPESIGKSYEHDDILYLDTSSVTENNFSELQRFRLNDAPSRAKRIIQDRDIVYSTVRPNLKHFGYINNPALNTVASTGFAVVRAKDEIDPRFLYYWLSSDERTNHLSSIADSQTSTFPAFNPSVLAKLKITLPSLDVQYKIAEILSILDEKIELNRKMNETLEQMGQALFKHYFITNPAAKEWGKVKLKEIVNNVKSPLVAGEQLADRIYLPIDRLQMKSLSTLEPMDYTEAKSSLVGFEKDDILVGAMRVYFHRVNIAPSQGVTRTTSFVLRPKHHNLLAFSALLINQEATIAYASSHSKGSTMPYAIWDNGLGEMSIALPPEELLNQFQETVWPLLELVRDSQSKIQTLITLRDTLLPRLISGKIKV